MKFYQLGFRYLQRKKGKTILMLIVLILVNSMILGTISTLLLAGVASKNASIEVQDKTRQAIGAGFLLERIMDENYYSEVWIPVKRK